MDLKIVTSSGQLYNGTESFYVHLWNDHLSKINKEDWASVFVNRKFLLCFLNEREVKFVTRFLNLDGEKEFAVGDLAREENISNKRVYQVISKALRKIYWHYRKDLTILELCDSDFDCDLQSIDKNDLQKLIDTKIKEKLQQRADSFGEWLKLLTQAEFNDNKIIDILQDEELFKKCPSAKAMGFKMFKEFQYRQQALEHNCKVVMDNIDVLKNTIPSVKERILRKSVESLNLNSWAMSCMYYGNINTIKELVIKSEKELMSIKNAGRSSIENIKQELNNYGLSLRPERYSEEEWLKKIYEEKEIKMLTEEDKFKQLLDMEIEDLDLSVRARNILKRYGINIVKDLVLTPKAHLGRLRNMGVKILNEIETKLQSMNLELMPDDETITYTQWIEILKQKYVSAVKNANVSNATENNDTNDAVEDEMAVKEPKNIIIANENWSIDEIPEKYRRTYARGAMLEAEEELNKNKCNTLIQRAILANANSAKNVVADKPIVKVYVKMNNTPKSLSFDEVMNEIKKDIYVINDLDDDFVIHYQTALKKFILCDSTFSVDDRLKVLERIEAVLSAKIAKSKQNKEDDLADLK